MKIEIGKTYRTRDGKKVVAEFVMPKPSRYASRLMTRVLTDEGWSPWPYNEDGTFGVGGGPNDLVSEWIEKPEWCKGNPAWARWQAHDEDGRCWWFQKQPTVPNGFKIWCPKDGGHKGEVAFPFAGPLPTGCRWQDSLVEAPESWGK